MRLKLQAKLSLSLAVLGILLTVLISLFSYFNSKQTLEKEYSDKAIHLSMSLANIIPGEDVKTMLEDGGENTETFDNIARIMNRYKQDNGLVYLFLSVPRENDILYLCDAYGPGDDMSLITEPKTALTYEDISATPEDYAAFRETLDGINENRGIAAPQVTDNLYGYMYSAYYPVRDKDGNAVALLTVSLSMDEVRAYLNRYVFTIIGGSVALIFICLIAYILFIRKSLVAPIAKLSAFAGKVTDSGGLSDEKIILKTGDEIGNLADSVNKMIDDIKSYVSNLAAVTSEKERIGAELNVATKIQSDMLPNIFPPFPSRDEFDIYATMLPAKEVGGDFYDFFLIDDDRLGVVIADVSGKGVPAALFMVIAKTLLKNQAQMKLSPDKVLEIANNQLCENNETGMFVTAFFGVLQISTGLFEFANAGHNPPVMYRKDGMFEYLKVNSGFVLAGMENIRYKPQSVVLGKGDMIYLYTDGVTEAMNHQNELYSEKRLINTLNALDAESRTLTGIIKDVKSSIDVFADGAEQADDITMLIFEMK